MSLFLASDQNYSLKRARRRWHTPTPLSAAPSVFFALECLRHAPLACIIVHNVVLATCDKVHGDGSVVFRISINYSDYPERRRCDGNDNDRMCCAGLGYS